MEKTAHTGLRVFTYICIYIQYNFD